MTDTEMMLRVAEAIEKIKKSGAKWGTVTIELYDGHARHVNYTTELIPPDPRDREKLKKF